MTIASWLLAVDPQALDETRLALARVVAAECRGVANGRLVVVTQSPDGRDLDPVQETLLAVPGVRGAALVAAFEEREEQHR